ncbi:MAG: hypothetical protein AAB676_04245 [Verrucomicrobiota bacterium]
MNTRKRFTRPIRHPWLMFCVGLLLVLGAVPFLEHSRSRGRHDVSAAEYADMRFDGIVVSNGVAYGCFTITNRHPDALLFYVNNVKVWTHGTWRHYASWSAGAPTTHPVLGRRANILSPGGLQKFLVRAPGEGEAWRIHVGVLRGIRGITLENRAAILLRTRSLATALSSSLTPPGGYGDFRFAGFLDGPLITSQAHSSTPAKAASPARFD